jgi:hypothetical protein
MCIERLGTAGPRPRYDVASVDVGYASQSDRLVRCREMTRWAISDILRCRKATAEQVEDRRDAIRPLIGGIARDGGISAKLWQKIARRARKRVA